LAELEHPDPSKSYLRHLLSLLYYEEICKQHNIQLNQGEQIKI